MGGGVPKVFSGGPTTRHKKNLLAGGGRGGFNPGRRNLTRVKGERGGWEKKTKGVA